VHAWFVFVCVLAVSDRLNLQSRARALCKRAHTYRQKLKEEGDRGGDGGGEERRRETHANAHTHRYLERQTQRHKTVT
jgi:hypothetical protein